MQLESYIYGEVCPDDVEVGEYIRFLVCLINQPWFKMTLHYCSDTKAVAFSGASCISTEDIILFSRYLISAGLRSGFQFAYSCFSKLSRWAYSVTITNCGCKLDYYKFEDDAYGFWSKIIPEYPDVFFKLLEESVAEVYGSDFNELRVKSWMMNRALELVNS